MVEEEKYLSDLLNKYRHKPHALIALMQDLQQHYGFLSEKILMLIAEKLHIPLAKIYGICTFYSQFKLKPHGKYVIQVCTGTACHVKGSHTLLEHFKEKYRLQPGQTSQDLLITLETVNCIGACSLSPTLMINHTVYGQIDTQKVDKLMSLMKQQKL